MLSCMPARTGTAHVVTTTRKYKDQVYRTHLLRRSYREGGVVKNETLGNLSHLPDALIDLTVIPLSALRVWRRRLRTGRTPVSPASGRGAPAASPAPAGRRG